MRRTPVLAVVCVVVWSVLWLLQVQAQSGPLTLLAKDSRRTIPIVIVNGQDFIGLDDVAPLFTLQLRDDSVAGGFVITARGRTLVGAANQPTVSVAGKVVSLPSSISHIGRRWLVPVEFLQLALGPFLDQRIQVRRASRLAIIGDLRVPRVSARVDSAGPPTRATVDIVPATAVMTAVESGRIVVRIEADALELALPADAGGLITQFRAGEQANTIAVQLEANAGPVRVSPQSGDVVTRLQVEVQGSAAPAPAPAGDTTARPAPAAAPPVTAESLVRSKAPLQTVIIDPGHGGDEIGAKGAKGVEEKQLTLDIAKRLRTLLEMRLGGRILLTRDGDTTSSLAARVAFANNNNGDLFLSIHGNAAPSSAVEGAEVYYLQLDRAGEQARSEATRSGTAIPVIGGGTRTLELIPWERAQAGHLDASAAFAMSVSQALMGRVPVSPSPIRRAPLRVLEGVNMPAALVELAYLSSPEQEKLVASEEFKNAAAQSLADAVARFRQYLEEHRPR